MRTLVRLFAGHSLFLEVLRLDYHLVAAKSYPNDPYDPYGLHEDRLPFFPEVYGRFLQKKQALASESKVRAKLVIVEPDGARCRSLTEQKEEALQLLERGRESLRKNQDHGHTTAESREARAEEEAADAEDPVLLLNEFATPETLPGIVAEYQRHAEVRRTQDQQGEQVVPVDFIKIDIDSIDCVVLRNLLRDQNLRPKVIAIEINADFAPPLRMLRHSMADAEMVPEQQRSIEYIRDHKGCSLSEAMHVVEGLRYSLFVYTGYDAVFLQQQVALEVAHKIFVALAGADAEKQKKKDKAMLKTTWTSSAGLQHRNLQLALEGEEEDSSASDGRGTTSSSEANSKSISSSTWDWEAALKSAALREFVRPIVQDLLARLQGSKADRVWVWVRFRRGAA
eukprot:g14935.t1